MGEDTRFRELLKQIRAGDQEAAAQLVREYEPAIRRAVRFHLSDNRLRRTLDSMDICQSVLANFFVRVAAGQFDLEDSRQLRQLLVKMARNRVVDQARRNSAGRRDQRRLVGLDQQALEAVADARFTPSRVLAGRELLDRVRAHLTEEERYLADQRGLGRDWAELAAELGVKPDALRMRLTRALDRVARQLGLDDDPV
jgi:RNA polymerase sigma-70 factor (ECF subfamily)